MQPELVPPFERNMCCWCESGRKYKFCHGQGPKSSPGAPVPPDDDDGYWLSPTVRADRGAFKVADVWKDSGVPVVAQKDEHPVAGPLIVPRYSAVLASDESTSATGSFVDSGLRRYEILSEYGLDGDGTLEAQLNALSDDALREIAVEFFKEGRRILDLLAANSALPEPANTLWTEPSTVASMVGQTLLWADHYLTTDSVLDALVASEDPDRDSIRLAIETALQLRPLIEAGVVVPVPAGTAALLVAQAIHESTRQDLEDPVLMEWLYNQFVIEGPTAREIVFVHARDNLGGNDFFSHSRVVLNDDGTFEAALLQPYQRDFNYEPWLKTVYRQYAAGLTQDLNVEIATARFFGSEYVTRVPFRARFAHQRSASISAPKLAASINVPWLPDVDPETLAKFASQDAAVQDLRRKMARAIKHVTDASVGQRELSDMVDEIAEDAVGPLARKLRRDKVSRLIVPGALSAGVVVLGVTTGPVAAIIGGAFGFGAWGGPAYADFREPRTDAAYLFWSARKQGDRRARSRR